MAGPSSIRRSMLLGAGCLVLAGALSVTFTFRTMRAGELAAQAERDAVREVGQFKDVRYHAIQVQQFMTDASATGDRAGVDDAREHATAALAGLEALARQDDATAAAARQLAGAVHSLVGTGEEMVDAYLLRGREAGNATMKRGGGFDDQAAAIAAQVEALARDLDARASEAQQVALAAATRAERLEIGVLVLFALVIAGMLYAMHVQLTRSLARLGAAIDACRGSGGGAATTTSAETMPREFAVIAASCDALFAELRAERDAQASIAQASARVQAALDRVSTNVLIADVEGAVIYANDAARAFFRLHGDGRTSTGADLVGQSLSQLMHSPDAALPAPNALPGKHVADMRLGAADIRLDATPVDDGQGRRLGIAVQWVDRTDEARTEREVHEVVASARAGDLTRRVPRDGKIGFFGALADGLNALLDGIAQLVERDIAPVVGRARTGDLTTRVPVAGKQGFFLTLADGLNDVLDNTSTLVSTGGATATEVASSAGEIATGNTHLSSRTESLAGSLAQLTHSMSQLAMTVRANADSAREANRLAGEARGHAERGGRVVSSANAAMAGINDASRKIQDIIVVIDELAFQTNLLALNAAVEAARAGEQGRGFAVVAGEVRNLASRSADAAKEIKALIQDSVERVNEGSRLVDDCGRTLDDIVSSVQHVASIVGEIASASSQQAAGVEEASRAVAGMDENTQQNAALVEETAAAAESLQERAAELRGVLASYRILSAGAGGAASAGGARRAAA